MTLEERVLEAKQNPTIMDQLLEEYTPFIKATISKTLKKYIGNDDESLTTGMMGFHEAVMKYDPTKGGFISYAQITIRSRVIDFLRQEVHQTRVYDLSLDLDDHEDTLNHAVNMHSMMEYENRKIEDQRKDDITVYLEILKYWDMTLSDLIQASPKKKELIDIYQKIGRKLGEDLELLAELRRTKRLPSNQIMKEFSIDSKRLERGRKYIIAVAELWAGDFGTLKSYIQGR